MSDVRKWYIGVYGGEAQARTCSPHPNEVIRDREGDTFVLSRDHMAREAELKQGITKHWKIVCDQRAKIDALQALLTAADEKLDRAGGAYLNKNAECLKLRERADVLEGLLREVQKSARKQDWASGYPTLFASVDAALKPAEGWGDEQ